MNFMRPIRHLLHAPASRKFPPPAMQEIERAIAQGEKQHDGEICFAVEARLPLRPLLAGYRARARAEELFEQLRVWDTARNSGVLIYVLLADHEVEIVPDRGLVVRLPGPSWNVIAELMCKHFEQDEWHRGALAGIKAMNALLARHLPARTGRTIQLAPDQPVAL